MAQESDRQGRRARRVIVRLIAAGALGAAALILFGFARGDSGPMGAVGVVAALILLVVARWALWRKR